MVGPNYSGSYLSKDLHATGEIEGNSFVLKPINFHNKKKKRIVIETKKKKGKRSTPPI